TTLLPQPPLSRRRVVDRAVQERSRQRPEVGERVDLLLTDRRGSGETRIVPEARMGSEIQVSTRARRELRRGQGAYVGALQPLQLHLVEARGVATHLLQREALDQLGRGENGLIVASPPAEQRQVVAHGLRQVSGLAQLSHRSGAMTLGELPAVRSVQQRQVCVL